MNKKRIYVLAGFFILIAVAAWIFRFSINQEKVTPMRGDVVEAIYGLGTVSADKIYNVRVGVAITVTKLFVNEGDLVSRGMPIIQVDENILMPTMKTNSESSRKEFAIELLNEFGIADKANSLPSQLSGGEQQRVAIARSIIMQPTYIFADEPTGNLDSANGQLVMNLFKKINKEHGTTIVYVTHDQEFASRLNCQWVISVVAATARLSDYSSPALLKQSCGALDV